jgi:hypothetical protein
MKILYHVKAPNFFLLFSFFFPSDYFLCYLLLLVVMQENRSYGVRKIRISKVCSSR